MGKQKSSFFPLSLPPFIPASLSLALLSFLLTKMVVKSHTVTFTTTLIAIYCCRCCGHYSIFIVQAVYSIIPLWCTFSSLCQIGCIFIHLKPAPSMWSTHLYLISHHKTPTKIQESVSTVHRPCISKQGVSVVKDLGHETSSSLTYAKTAIIAVPGKKEGFPVENIPSKCFRLEAQENYSGHDYIKMISLGPVICRCDVESLVWR